MFCGWTDAGAALQCEDEDVSEKLVRVCNGGRRRGNLDSVAQAA